MIARGLSLLVIAWALGFAAFASTLSRPLAGGLTDAIVVPTGGAGRIERGLALIGERRARRMLISGVGIAVRPHELALRTGTPRAVFECCVDLGDRAVDTRSNAEEVGEWVRARRYRSVRLVTSDWHMRRAAFEIRRALPPGVTLQEDAVRTQPRLGVLLNEYNKYVLRRAAALAGL